MTKKIDKILTVIFLLCAVVAFVAYFAVTDKRVFLYAAGIAICIRLFQYFTRFVH